MDKNGLEAGNTLKQLKPAVQAVKGSRLPLIGDK